MMARILDTRCNAWRPVVIVVARERDLLGNPSVRPIVFLQYFTLYVLRARITLYIILKTNSKQHILREAFDHGNYLDENLVTGCRLLK
jgi:hypothetical protein